MIKHNLLHFKIPHVVDTHHVGKEDIGHVLHDDIVRVYHCFPYDNYTFGILPTDLNGITQVGLE